MALPKARLRLARIAHAMRDGATGGLRRRGEGRFKTVDAACEMTKLQRQRMALPH